MAPAAMMNDLAYSLLLAQSDNIHMYYFTRINTHRPLGKKKGSQEIFQILLKKNASLKFQKNLFGLEGTCLSFVFQNNYSSKTEQLCEVKENSNTKKISSQNFSFICFGSITK